MFRLTTGLSLADYLEKSSAVRLKLDIPPES